jgi:hypothetical protein
MPYQIGGSDPVDTAGGLWHRKVDPKTAGRFLVSPTIERGRAPQL